MKYVRRMLDIDDIHEKGIEGEGVGIAILDTGISMHEDFMKTNSRIICFKDFVNKEVPSILKTKARRVLRYLNKHSFKVV